MKAAANRVVLGKNINVKGLLYRGLQVLFALAIGGSAIAKLSHDASMVQAFEHLGYPMYLASILGVSYLLGIVGIFQNKVPVLREWAHAGFTVALIGAFVSHLSVGDSLGQSFPPLVLLGALMASYYLGKQLDEK